MKNKIHSKGTINKLKNLYKAHTHPMLKKMFKELIEQYELENKENCGNSSHIVRK